MTYDHRIITLLFEVQIFEMYWAEHVACTTYDYDSTAGLWRGGFQEDVFEEVEEKEMAEMVCSHLHFESFDCGGFGTHHDSSVTYQDIERRTSLEEVLSSGANAGKA